MRFGFDQGLLDPPLILLDKSYLLAISGPELEYLARDRVFFISDVLLYELTHEDRESVGEESTRCLQKLYRLQKGLAVAPSIGAMLQFEAKNLIPASSSIPVITVELTPERLSSGRLRFGLLPKERAAIRSRSRRISSEARLLDEIWKTLGDHASLQGAKPSEVPDIVREIATTLRDDPDVVRDNFQNIRHESLPPARVIDEQWAYFRWIQVYILAGLEHYQKYGGCVVPKQDRLENERLDLDYTVTALLLGGLASCDATMMRRFRFLRPNGLLLQKRFDQGFSGTATRARGS